MFALDKRRLARRLVAGPPRPRTRRTVPATGRKSRSGQGRSPLTESQIHASVASLLDWILVPPALYTTFPAGVGKFSKAMAGQLKHRGLKAGMPDILVFYAGRCLGLELKKLRSYMSKAQVEMKAKLEAAGVHYVVCRSQDDVITALRYHEVPIRLIKTWQDTHDPWLDTPPSCKSEPPGEICARPAPSRDANEQRKAK